MQCATARALPWAAGRTSPCWLSAQHEIYNYFHHSASFRVRIALELRAAL